MYRFVGKSVLNDNLGSSSDPCYIQNRVIMNCVIKRLRCIWKMIFIAPAYSKVRYRGSTFRPLVRSSVRPQFMSRCLLCSSDSWEYETLHSNYP